LALLCHIWQQKVKVEIHKLKRLTRKIYKSKIYKPVGSQPKTFLLHRVLPADVEAHFQTACWTSAVDQWHQGNLSTKTFSTNIYPKNTVWPNNMLRATYQPK